MRPFVPSAQPLLVLRRPTIRFVLLLLDSDPVKAQYPLAGRWENGLTSAMRLYTCHISSSSSGRNVTCPYILARPRMVKLTDPSLLIDLLTSFMLDYDCISLFE
jgi:hypothetical protein